MAEMRFSRFARQNPDAVAIVDPDERAWSRGTLAAAANRFARALRVAGLKYGDSFAVVAPNCYEYMVAYLAATQIGLYFVPINWHLAPAEISYILNDADVRGLVVHHRFELMIFSVLEKMQCPPSVRVSIGSIDGFFSLEDFGAEASDAPLTDAVMGRNLAYTSATTGRPKGVMLPLDQAERALDISLEGRMAVGTAPEEHVQLCASMLYHGAPLESMVAALHMGHVVVLMGTAAPEAILQWIEKYRVTMAYIVPTMFSRLLSLNEAVRNRYSLSGLRRVVHTGAPCSVDVKRRVIEWLGPIVWEAYGAAEGSGTVASANDWLKYPGTVGRPFARSRLKIVGDDGQELSAGSIGTIYLTRHTGERFYYRGDPEKTQACYLGEFFTVGDIGYVNDEGFLFICDRKIDMIIRSGLKVYPAEIESVLIRHPKVADCAVFGVPDKRSGESIVAVVQLVKPEDESRALSLELLQFLGGYLSSAKLPQSITFTAALPRDPTGKLQKKRLREQFCALQRDARLLIEARHLGAGAAGTDVP